MLFEIGCEKFSQGAVILENRILGCDLASLVVARGKLIRMPRYTLDRGVDGNGFFVKRGGGGGQGRPQNPTGYPPDIRLGFWFLRLLLA